MNKKLRNAAFKLMDVIMILTMIFGAPLNVAAAPQAQAESPALSTNLADYAPGELAHITGSSFDAGDYALSATGPDGTADWGTVTADEDGGFESDSPALASAGTYEISAYAADSEESVASISFTVTAPPAPTDPPTEEPTATEPPTEQPTQEPPATEPPTAEPTDVPTIEPTEEPTATAGPTQEPTSTEPPTEEPTQEPTLLPPPYIQSDKVDYAPGELVTVTGGNWLGDLAVRIVVNDDIGQAWRRDVTVPVALDGTISDSFNLPSFFVATYSVTATGQQTGRVATTWFTDTNVGLYDQCANDDGDGYPAGNSDPGCQWTNGNLQSNNSTYAEGDATVQRLWLNDMVPGSTHTLRLKYGTTKGGNHAYDYLTTWNYSENWITDADLCQDIDANANQPGGSCTLWGADDLFPIPFDPNPAFVTDGVPQPAGRNFTMRNGDITAATTPMVVSGTYAGDSETVITITFTVLNDTDACVTKQGVTTCSVVLWFGAHVALTSEWETGGGAGEISGSPYHVALDALDGAAVGQRDNQMQAGAVVPNGTIVIIKDAVPNSAQDFSFNLTNGTTVNLSFLLDDDADGTLPSTTSPNYSLPPGTYTAQELNIPAGWTLTNLVCVDPTSNTTVNIPAATASINLASNETVTCTYTDTNAGRIIVDKVTVPSGDPQSFSFDAVGGSYADFSLTDAAAANNQALSPGNYSVSETVPSGWDLTSATCSSSIGDTESTAGIELDAGETVTCTFTNTKRGNIIVEKQTNPDGSSQSFEFDPSYSANFFLTDGQQNNSGPLVAGTYSVAEVNVPVDWVLSNTNCSSSIGDTETAGSIELDSGETVTCIFTNTKQTASLTVSKTPDQTEVCNGTEVTYTYEVTNTGTATLTVNLEDDLLGDIDGGAGFSLAPGASQTFTASSPITGTVTNTVTATGTSTGGQTATATADATVTGHDCTITVTKEPSATNVCDGGSVTYTYTVTNNSDEFTWTGTLSDNQLGTIDGSITLAPGGSDTFTASDTITGTVTNIATASGSFDDGSSTSASDMATATVTGHDCTITVTKSPSATNVCEGGLVTYTYTVTNHSDFFTWTGSLEDDQLGTIAEPITLTPGETESFTDTANITGTVINIVTASGTFSDGGGTSASDTASATVTSHDCTITVTKSPSATNICDGNEVTYTYTVTNNSDEFTWTGTLNDDQIGAINGTITLGPGEDETFTASANITGSVTNIATASGTFDDDSGTSASDTASATVTSHDCTITVTKSPSATNVCDGGEVTYTYTVTNNSDSFTWTGSLEDDQLGTIADPVTLTPGEIETFTTSASITGTVTNTVTADGAFNDPDATSASDTASATVTSHNCTISITKTPSADNVCNDSDTEVTYTIVVTNNSSQFAWTGDVIDTVLGTLATAVTIPAGQSVSYTPTHVVNATTTNTVTAAGAFDNTHATAASDSDSATVTGHDCTISITKTPSVTNVCNGSDTEVTYTYLVTNDSDFFNVSGSVSDDQLGSIGTFTDLAPGANATFTQAATVNGTITNVATVSGTFDDSVESTDTDTATATVTGHDCSISISKSPSVGDVCIGSDTEVNYTITVTNNSDQFDWTGDVTDTVFGTLATSVTIPAGDSVTYTPSHLVNATTANTATADGAFNDVGATASSDSASATVTAHICTITITKTPSVDNVCNGSNTEVTYIYVVTNNSDFFNVSGSVTDDQLGNIGAFTDLAPGGTETFTKVTMVNGTITNIATATGTFSDSDATTDSDTATATVTGHDCSITVTKSPSATNVCNGGVVTYTYTVVNNSDFFTWAGTLTDDQLGAIDGPITLGPGASQTFTASANITGTVTNIATASGTFDDASSTSASDSASATVTSHDCSITITKSPSATDVCDGGEVTYTYTIINNSDAFTWTGYLEDDQLGPIAASITLGPGASDTFTASAAITGTVTNTATASGTFDDDSATSASDEASATVTSHDCTITVTKSPSATNVCEGGGVTYTYTVTNGSDQFTWTGSLVDDQLGTIAASITLGPGASDTFTASADITGTVTNTATASGTFDDDSSTSASDSASATVTSHDCTITVTKSPSATDVCDGGTVTYTYTVSNNSDQFTWTGTLTDDKLGAINGTITLGPGDSQSFTASANITGTVTNTATASGTFDDDSSTSASDSASATVTSHDCTITVTKEPSQTNVCNGSTVTYSYTVHNNSDFFTWTGSLTDDTITLPAAAASFSVAPGQDATFTASGVINGVVTNIATASGNFDDDSATAASDTDTATVTGHDCTISITKTPSETNVCNGSEVTYTIVVTNNSDEFDWTGDVVDDVLGTLDTDVTIAAGGTSTYTPSDTISGVVHNTVTASGSFNDSTGPVSAEATANATVTGHNCSITVTKSPSATDVCDGGEVTYAYTVHNNSDFFTWTGSLVDDQLGTIADPITLAPGETETFTASAAITGTVTNTATASGTFGDPDATSASDTASATVTSHDCSITVTKSPSATNVCDGGEVTYTYTVTNNSDQFTWTGTLTDDQLGAINGTITLTPGETESFTASADITGTVTNTATASGTFDDDSSTSASDSASATVTSHGCTISITKTPSTANVCNGSNTQVTYTYVITNDSDFFNVSGSVSDNQLGSIGTFGPLAPGASATLTKVATINGTVTNTATATGTFDDPNDTSDSDTATATVTGHNCTISITKTPSTANVCNGSNTQVTYTYVVTNNSDFYSVSGSVEDDQFGTIGTFGPLAPGASATLTKVGTVNGTVTNIATATGTFNDTASSTDSDTATATVTGHNCTISITKTPSSTDVCNGKNTSVTYTYVVTNNSNFYSVSGSVTDNVLGSIGTFTNLAPGASQTFTKVATVNATTTNTGTATGTFNDVSSTSATASANATVTGRNCQISITKTPSTTTICVGASTQVTYTFVVKNEGEVTLTNVSVVDNLLGTIASGLTLTPGQSQTFTRTTSLSTTTTNTVTASGTALGATVTATATATVTVGTTPCPLTPGYWKNHMANSNSTGPFTDPDCRRLPNGNGCSNNGPWVKQYLPKSLGNYQVTGILLAAKVFNSMNCSSSKPNDAIGCLAGHLLAAKLNVANGAGNACIAAVIAKADNFLKAMVVDGVTGINYIGPTGNYTLTTAQRNLAISLKNALDKYNNNQGCP